MSIRVKCKECGKVLKAPDSAAGKRAKCPACGKPIEIPEPVYDAEAVEEPDESEDFEEQDTYGFEDVSSYDDAPAEPGRRPCPMCGEMIVTTAAKCRYCGEIFDATLKRKASKEKGRGASSSYDGELTTTDWLLCIFCGGIGCIVGIVALCRGDSSRGGKMIGISLAFGFLWNVIRFMIERAAQ